MQHDADTAQSGAIRAGIGRIRLGGERRRPGRGAWQGRACHGQDAAHAAAAATDPTPAIASTGLIVPAARCVPETPVFVAEATSALVCPRRLRSERIRSRDRSSHAPPAAADNRGARGSQRIQTRMGRARHRAAGPSIAHQAASLGRQCRSPGRHDVFLKNFRFLRPIPPAPLPSLGVLQSCYGQSS